MKAILILASLLAFSPCPAQASDWKPKPSIDRQLARILTPLRHWNRHLQCIVVVQFQISEDSRICRVQVHANDPTVSEQLIQQLTGRKLAVQSSDFATIHTVRVHFQRPDHS